ncbi:helix-turn-helix domain-containing protein [Kribbella sp. NBC_01245]|uniref:IclR family transcriptional regulator n=1 Tax=Kribbella sp. NBC_01245 TaxID=2903578 RepID=UPI002E2C513F|nr:helix-turn-helix domain-containing protein [Kribbella sp. NBC_01245]
MDDHTVAGRVAAILDAVSAGPGPATLARLAAETCIPKPTVRRIANQLVDQRMLRRDPQGYRLGLRLIELGGDAATQLGTAELAAPFVHELHERTRQIAWVGTVDHDSLVVLDTAYAREHAPIMAAAWSSRLPMTAPTAAANLILAAKPAHVEQILRSGGPTRLTPHTVTSPRLLLGKLQRAADTGIAHEWEETRLGWWCCAMLVPAPAATYIFGLTAETHRTPMACGVTQLQRVAEHFGREVNWQARVSTAR